MATTTQNPFPPGDDAAKTTPPAVIPTTAAPSTTPQPAVIFSNVQITDKNFTAEYPVVGTGGVEDSYRNTTGKVTVDNIVLNEPFNEELTYVVYDANGPKDEYGDPKVFATGKTGTTTDNTGKPIVKINETIKVTADSRNGNMQVAVLLRDKNFTTKTAPVQVQNPVTPPVTGTERTQELKTRTTTTTTTKKPGEGGQIVAAVEDCKDCCSAPIWLPDRTEDNWFESYWPKIEPRVYRQDGPVRAALEGVPDEPRHRARLDNAFRDGIPPDGWNVIPGASPEDQEGYNPDCWVRVDVTFDTGRGTGVETQWWCKAALRGECEDLKFRAPEIPGVPERFTDTEGYNIPEGDELFDRMHDWGQGTDNGGITKVPYPWKWEYGPDTNGNGYPNGGEWVKDPDPFPDHFDPGDDSVKWKPHAGDGSGWGRNSPDGSGFEFSDWSDRFPDVDPREKFIESPSRPGEGIPPDHPGLDPHIRNGGKRIPPGIALEDLFGWSPGRPVPPPLPEGINVIIGPTEMETIGQTTTVRPATTQAPVPPIGDPEVDEVVTAQGPAHIQITDVTVNNTTIEDNVDLTVEISNADHWNFSIDGGSNVRVNSYDLDHQLCADQAFDPHGVDAPPPRFGLSEEEKLFEDALAELEGIAEEQADERSEELIDELTDNLTKDLDEFEEVLEEAEKLLEPIQDAFDRAGVDINDDEAVEALMANDPVIRRQVENLAFAIERTVDFVEVMGAVLEEAIPEIVEDLKKNNPDAHKDLAKELLKKLKDGTLTVEDLAKIMSRAPGLGTGGALDELLYRKGWIPPGRGGQWLPPYRGRAPNPRARGFFGSITDSSICSHDAPCDSPSRTVTLTVEPGEHDVLVTALDANYTPLTTASSRFAVNGPSNEVSSQDQLIAALRSFSDVKLTDNFEITKTIEVPAGAKIIGVGNPVISTTTTAFSIKESNVKLNGFTITKSRTSTVPTGPGVLIDRPNRNSRVAPSNITIKNITFNGLGTAGVNQTSPITILGFNKLDTTPLSDEKLSILGATNQPINNINIEDNVFNISINTAIEAWEVHNLNISNNTIRNSRSNGIKVTNITKSNILSNRINQIAGSGILLQGSRSNNIKVEGNTVSTFGSVFPIAPDGFKTGIGTLNGVNGVEIVSNNIDTGSNFWNAGISVKQGSSNILIDNNSVDNIRDGIYIGDESDSVNVKDNIITNVKRYGIQTYRSWAINLLNNDITQSSEALKTFESLSKIQQRTIGIGCGILIGSCNGVTIFSNVINGTYREQNGDSAILISRQYPITDIDQAGVEYGVYDSGSLTDIYGSPGQQVTDSLIEIIVSNNTHQGEGKLLQSNGARLILPGVDPSKDGAAGGGDNFTGDDVTVPEVATTKMPVIVTSTTPPVVRTTKPPGGIVTGPTTTTTTTTTQRPKGTIIIVPPTGTNTDGAVDTFIDQNTDLTDNNEVVIVNTDPEDPSSGFTQTETGTTPYVGDKVIISSDPQTPVTTTTTTTTTIAPRRTADGRTAEQIARDNYISTYIELNDARKEVFNRYISGLISITELGREGAILTNRYDVEGKKIEYENIRYTDGLWKENLSNWIDTRSISPCSKKISQELIKLMPQDFEDQDLYWAGNSVLDTSGISEAGTTHYDRSISYRENMKTVRKAAVLISPIHVLMPDHWRYAPYKNEQGEMIYPELTWEMPGGEKITRVIVEEGVKVPGVDTRVLILNEPVPDKLAIYPLPAPHDNYNDLLTGSLVLIGNQQRKYTVGYVMAAVPTIQYNSIFNEGNDGYTPAISEGHIRLSFDAKLPFLNRWIPTKYSSFDDGDRPESYAELDGTVKGDSGSPNFILSPNGDPILISQHQLGGTSPKMPFLGDSTVQEHIKNAMDTLSDKHNLPRYGLRTIDPCTGKQIGVPNIIIPDGPGPGPVVDSTDDDDIIDDPIIVDPPIILVPDPEEPDSPGLGQKNPEYDPEESNRDGAGGSGEDLEKLVEIDNPSNGGGFYYPNGGVNLRQLRPGCMDDGNQPWSRFPGEPALNFDPLAEVHDNSCIWAPHIKRGCTDPAALNHDPLATHDDGSCRYPIIFVAPTTQPPYIPATCREPPVLPLGETEETEETGEISEPGDGGTDNIEDRVDIEQEANEPVAKIFPAPVNAVQIPFNSEVNFNTNITKKTPTPYGFTTAPPDGGEVEPVDESITATTTICPPDNENCNTLQY